MKLAKISRDILLLVLMLKMAKLLLKVGVKAVALLLLNLLNKWLNMAWIKSFTPISAVMVCLPALT
jgi:hypothetical protein